MIPLAGRRRRPRGPGVGMRSEGERREYIASYLVLGTVRVLLGVALLASAVQSYLVLQKRSGASASSTGNLLPALLVVGGAFALRSGFRSLRAAVAVHRAGRRPGPPESTPGRSG